MAVALRIGSGCAALVIDSINRETSRRAQDGGTNCD
jgi:hypothetical protein